MLILLAVLFSNAALTAKKIRIGVSIPTAGHHGWTGRVVWWAKQAIQDWKAKDPDVIFFLVTAASPSQQVSQIEDLMVKGIDALVIQLMIQPR